MPENDTVFVYLIDGDVSFDGGTPDDRTFVERRRAVLLTPGDTVVLTSSPTKDTRCVLFAGTPLRESVAWGGPIVMNTQEELNLAFRELDDGTFIKHG